MGFGNLNVPERIDEHGSLVLAKHDRNGEVEHKNSIDLYAVTRRHDLKSQILGESRMQFSQKKQGYFDINCVIGDLEIKKSDIPLREVVFVDENHTLAYIHLEAKFKVQNHIAYLRVHLYDCKTYAVLSIYDNDEQANIVFHELYSEDFSKGFTWWHDHGGLEFCSKYYIRGVFGGFDGEVSLLNLIKNQHSDTSRFKTASPKKITLKTNPQAHKKKPRK
jgi:hypothetical protein